MGNSVMSCNLAAQPYGHERMAELVEQDAEEQGHDYADGDERATRLPNP